MPSFAAIFELRQYRQTNTVQIFDDLLVPEPQDAKALVPKYLIPHSITHTICVLKPVHLDDQPRFEADEIEDVTGVLPVSPDRSARLILP